MKEILLIAGHHAKDPGAIGNGFKEADLTMEFRELLKVALEFQMNDYKRNYKISVDNDSYNLTKVVNWINSLKNEERLIIDIHFNAFNKTANGTEVIVPKHFDANERDLGKIISKTIASVLGVHNRGCIPEDKTARKSLAIMRPKGVNILIEVCFIDNLKDIQAYQSKKNDLAWELAKQILQYEFK